MTPSHLLLAPQPPTRLQKSLQGATCCFCTESLEYTLAGEKVVVFECAHTSHHECLLQLVDQAKARHDAQHGLETFMPLCTICGEACVPLDESILAEIVQPDNDTNKSLMPRKWSSASDSDFSSFSHLSHSSISSFDSFDLGITESAVTTPTSPSSTISTNLHLSSPVSLLRHSSFASFNYINHNTYSAVYELAPAIPSAVLHARTVQIPTVEIQITPEFESATIGEYITTAVTVRAPPVAVHPNTTEPVASISSRRAATQLIRNNVSDWKQLDFEQFGLLRLVDTCHVASKREGPWRMLDCYLFDKMLVFVKKNCVKRDKNRSFSGASRVSTTPSVRSVPSTPSFIAFTPSTQTTNFSSASAFTAPTAPIVRGTIALKEDLVSVSVSSKTATLTLNLAKPELPAMHLRFTEGLAALENWYSALIDDGLMFPSSRLAPPVFSPPVPKSLTATGAKPKAHRLSSLKLPLDTVVLVPLLSVSGSAGSKFTALRYALKALVTEMGLFDRLAIVPYGSDSSSDRPSKQCHALAPGTWRYWSSFIESLAPAAPARVSTKTDLTNGVAAALTVLAARKTRNPVTSIVIIMDSNLSSSSISHSYTPSIDSELLERAAAAGVALHGLGVSAAHNADTLRALAPDSYSYVRRWAELGATLVGLYRGLVTAAHRNVVVQITAHVGSNALDIVDEVHSINQQKSFQRTTLTESQQSTPSKSSLESIPDGQKHEVKIDMLLSGESRTFLVQTTVPPSGQLFEVRASSTGQQAQKMLFSKHIAKINAIVPNSSQCLGSQYGPTSIIYGSPTAHVQVSRRRVHIAVIRALEALSNHPDSSISSALPASASSGLAFITALRNVLQKQPYSLVGNSRLITDADATALNELARLIDVLDTLFAETVAARDGNRAVFEQDVRKLLLQSVGVLNKERAYTLRTPLEGLFLQRQVLNNVISTLSHE